METNEILERLRNSVDDLYDAIQTPTHEMSCLYLHINDMIDELQSGSNLYVSRLDPNNLEQVELLLKFKK